MVMLRAGSREYLLCDVLVSGEAPSTPTVEMAVVARGSSPLESDWTAASWDGQTARRLLDPALPGRFDVFVRVTDLPERPVLYAGRLEVK